MNQLTVSLWGDEGFSALISQKTIPSIISIASHDTAPPLYYIVLHIWMRFFGTTEVALRSLSLVLFLLVGVAMYLFAKSVFGRRSAIFVALLTILNPFLFQYAFEARMYMLLVLMTVLSMWFFVKKRWILYVITTVLALYSHHFALFVVMVQVVYYIFETLVSIFQKRLRFREFFQQQLHPPFLRSFAVILILYAPWIPVLIHQSSRVTSDFWLGKPSIPQFFVVFSNFAIGTDRIAISYFLVGLCVLLLLFRGLRKKTDVLLYLWLFLPPLVTFFLSLVSRPIFFDRYLIISVPALPLLLGTHFSLNEKKISAKNRGKVSRMLERKNLFTTTCLTLLIAGLVYSDLYLFTHPDKQPFRDLARFIQMTIGPQKQIINYYTNHLHYFELKYYGIPVKIYSPSPVPFWVGTALIDPNDELQVLPQDKTLYIMASGAIQKIVLPGYQKIQQVQFNQLYLFVYQHDFN